MTQIDFEVRRYLGLEYRASLGEALARRIPRGPGRARPILLLDWGVRGTTEATRLHPDELSAWLAFCSQKLGAQCPRELRLISCLALESAPERHAALEQAVQKLRADSRFRDRAFRLELLPPLDQINASDLADFLDNRSNSTCPDDLIAVLPELLVRKTGGQFRATVELIEQAERTSWYGLYDQLCAEFGLPTDEITVKDDLL